MSELTTEEINNSDKCGMVLEGVHAQERRASVDTVQSIKAINIMLIKQFP